MTTSYQQFNSFVREYYTARLMSLGEAFCEMFHIDDEELRREHDEDKCLRIILNRYVGASEKKVEVPTK